jgi:hypothetical protein
MSVEGRTRWRTAAARDLAADSRYWPFATTRNLGMTVNSLGRCEEVRLPAAYRPPWGRHHSAQIDANVRSGRCR